MHLGKVGGLGGEPSGAVGKLIFPYRTGGFIEVKPHFAKMHCSAAPYASDLSHLLELYRYCTVTLQLYMYRWKLYSYFTVTLQGTVYRCHCTTVTLHAVAAVQRLYSAADKSPSPSPPTRWQGSLWHNILWHNIQRHIMWHNILWHNILWHNPPAPLGPPGCEALLTVLLSGYLASCLSCQVLVGYLATR